MRRINFLSRLLAGRFRKSRVGPAREIARWMYDSGILVITDAAENRTWRRSLTRTCSPNLNSRGTLLTKGFIRILEAFCSTFWVELFVKDVGGRDVLICCLP